MAVSNKGYAILPIFKLIYIQREIMSDSTKQ